MRAVGDRLPLIARIAREAWRPGSAPRRRPVAAVALLCLVGCLLSVLPAAAAVPSVAAAVPSVAAPAGVARPADTAVAAGSFHALAPVRVVDTRFGVNGTWGPVGPGRALIVPMLGSGGLPAAGVSAVALNVTVSRATVAGFATVYADGTSLPTASNINFPAGGTVADTVLAQVGADGKVRLYNGSAGSVDFLADVVGYFSAGMPTAAGTFAAVAPSRLLDTRFAIGAPVPSVGPNTSVSVAVTGRGGIPAAGAAAVAVTLTATGATAGGYLSVYAEGSSVPMVSNVNFIPGETVATLVLTRVGTGGRIRVFHGGGGTVQVIADVAGYYLPGAPTVAGALQMVTPVRLLDTRSGLGARGPVRANAAVAVRAAGVGGIPTYGAGTLVLSTTVVGAVPGGYLTVFADGTARPAVSTLNPVPPTTSNMAMVPAGNDGLVDLYNGAGPSDLVTDVFGYYRSTTLSPCAAVPPDPAGTTVTRWNPVVQCVLWMLGQPAGEVGDVDIVITYESSGDPWAINNWDSNAQAGHPSEGLIQVIRPTFDYYRSPELPDDLYDPAANLFAGLNYAVATYGSIHNIPGLVSLRNGGGYVGYLRTR